jgi:lysozyme
LKNAVLILGGVGAAFLALRWAAMQEVGGPDAVVLESGDVVGSDWSGGLVVSESGPVFQVDEPPNFVERIGYQVEATARSFSGSSVQDMKPSEALKDVIKKSERLVLKRYELGDGGYTIGYGHFEAYGGKPLPESITKEQAEAMFDEDIEARAAKWVRAFVTVDLIQNQFDALTHMAYNLSPKSFKKVATALNEGGDWKAVALTFVRAGTNLERGLRLRRGREFAMFESAVYG